MRDKQRQSFGTRLAETRGSSGLTQEQLAEELGVSKRTVSDWERDINWPMLGSFVDLCEALAVNAHWLLFGDGIQRRMEIDVDHKDARLRDHALDCLRRADIDDVRMVRGLLLRLGRGTVGYD